MKYLAPITAATLLAVSLSSNAFAASDPLADLFSGSSSTTTPAATTPAATTPAATTPAATTTTGTTDPLADLFKSPATPTTGTTTTTTPAATTTTPATTTPAATTGGGSTGGGSTGGGGGGGGGAYYQPGSSTAVGEKHAAAPATLADVKNIKTEVHGTSIKVTWDYVAGADSYTLYYGKKSVTKDGGDYEKSVPVKGPATEYTLTGLDANMAYYFTLTAEDSTAKSAGSEFYAKEVSATTGTAAQTTAFTATTNGIPSAGVGVPVGDKAQPTTAVKETPPTLPKTGLTETLALAAALSLAAAVKRRSMKK